MGVVEDGKAAAVAFEEAVTKSRKALRAGCEYRWGDRTQFETYLAQATTAYRLLAYTSRAIISSSVGM